MFEYNKPIFLVRWLLLFSNTHLIFAAPVDLISIKLAILLRVATPVLCLDDDDDDDLKFVHVYAP